MRRLASIVLSLLLAAGCSSRGLGVVQRADAAFAPAVEAPRWAVAAGPRVLIDEAHANYHTMEGRYAPFAELLRREGYRVAASALPFDEAELEGADVLVISNALAASDVGDWSLPTEPAFTDAEVAAVRDWVEGGGALLLVADHMPFPGAAEKLAAAFGLFFHNGFAMPEDRDRTLVFRKGDGTLAEHEVTEGIDSVKTFTGQAFRAGREVQPLLTIPEGIVVFLPGEAWELDETTPRIPAEGLLQGAVFEQGAGRVAVFGEAAMFTAQEIVRGEERTVMGMNAEGAEHNGTFLLNLMRWLSKP